MKIIFLLSMLTIGGCSTKLVYVAKPPLQENLVFTVIPANLENQEIRLASGIQDCLIAKQIPVLERPPLTQQAAQVGADSGKQVTDYTFDSVQTFAKTSANIIVTTDARNGVVKFIKKENDNNQVLVSQRGSWTLYTDTLCSKINGILEAIDYKKTIHR